MLSMPLDILTNAYLGKTSTNLFPLFWPYDQAQTYFIIVATAT